MILPLLILTCSVHTFLPSPYVETLIEITGIFLFALYKSDRFRLHILQTVTFSYTITRRCAFFIIIGFSRGAVLFLTLAAPRLAFCSTLQWVEKVQQTQCVAGNLAAHCNFGVKIVLCLTTQGQ